MKKILLMVLVLAVAASLFAISASADAAPFTATITNAKSYYQPGDTFEIVISKSGTADIQGVTQKVKPSDTTALTWSKSTCVNGDMFDSKTFGTNLVFWDATETNTGKLVTIPVTVATTATLGKTYTIDLSGTWTDGSDDHSYTLSLEVKVDHDHSQFATKVSAKAKSCTVAGNKEYYECTCGKLFTTAACTEETTLEAVTIAACHEITHKTAKEATCAQKGNVEYWECTVCHTLFSDALGTTTTTKAAVETEKDSTNHTGTAIYHAAVPNSCTTAGSIEYYECPDCHAEFTTAAMSISVADHTIAATNHVGTVDHVEAGPATCAVGGHGEYWHCTKCDKYFSNADCAAAHEIDASAINVGALGHEYAVTWEWASDNKSATATFTCSVCGASESGHVATVTDSSIDVEHTKLPTCAVKGTDTLTASVEKPANTKSFTGSLTDTKTVDVEATGDHKYVLTYNWNADHTACTCDVKCDTCDTENQTGVACTVATDTISKAATHLKKGFTIYTAAPTGIDAVLASLKDPAQATNVVEVENLDIIPHDVTLSFVAEKAATTSAAGMKAHYVCSCGTMFAADEDGNPTSEVVTEAQLTIAKLQDDTDKKTSPKTGDSNNIVLWTLVLTVSAVSVGAVLNLTKKSEI